MGFHRTLLQNSKPISICRQPPRCAQKANTNQSLQFHLASSWTPTIVFVSRRAKRTALRKCWNVGTKLSQDGRLSHFCCKFLWARGHHCFVSSGGSQSPAPRTHISTHVSLRIIHRSVSYPSTPNKIGSSSVRIRKTDEHHVEISHHIYQAHCPCIDAGPHYPYTHTV